ncbi:pyridoxamine 5'-phosphate oxidase family protein [Nocardia terpenica]
MPTAGEGVPSDTADPHCVEAYGLSDADSLGLLAGIGFGRIVFSRYALPAVRLVNHIVDDGLIVVDAGGDLSPYRQVVAFEADTIDPRTRLGWCVIATGTAESVTDPAEIDRYHALLRPLLPGNRDHMVRIQPDLVTGIEYRRSSAPG